jgi:DNA topoisomerase I
VQGQINTHPVRLPEAPPPLSRAPRPKRSLASRPTNKVSAKKPRASEKVLPPHVTPEAIATAKSAGLRYLTDTAPGITRESAGKSFRFRGVDGTIVREAAALARIKHLAIPPAWTDVWICPLAHGHIQATGRDARRRKQYRYHPEWQAVRDQTKYERMIAFGRALPFIRKTVAKDLLQSGLGRTKVLAAVVRLLETTLIRIGNEEYAKQNQSFGLSTMRDRHVKVESGVIHFEFRGKSGKNHEIDLHDARLASIVRQAQDLPGQDLFQYVGEDGHPQKITSEDVNRYIREVAGEEFSAKDFRTWAGTVLAAMALREFEGFDSKAQAKKNLVRAIEHVAERLGNTPAVCKKCYIHPVILDSYLDGTTVEILKEKSERALRKDLASLTPEEAAVLAFVQQRLSTRKPAA